MDFYFVKRKSVPKKKFTPEEDEQLKQLVERFGDNDWERVAAMLVNRNARQCHDRWKFYINPKINKEPFTKEEDWLLINLVSRYGGMWVQISKHFKNRSDVQMKNRWKALQKQLQVKAPTLNPYSNFYQNPLSFQQPSQNTYVSNVPMVTQQSAIPDDSINLPLDTNLFGIDHKIFEAGGLF